MTPRSPFASHWSLDPNTHHLNHGSFGACPTEVLAKQQAFREQMERNAMQFLVRDLERLLDDARAQLAQFLGATEAGLAFVPNATTGVNAVVRSVPLSAGDEVLVTNHGYAACRNAVDFSAALRGARVIVAEVPFPPTSNDEIVEAIILAATPKTSLALIDHVTSPTGLVWPIADIVDRLAERGVDTVVDGAHAAGMLPLDISRIGAAYYVGNCHKWLCAPKGAGFLWVRGDRIDKVRPHVISHGATSQRRDRSRFLAEFDWTGTLDPSPYLCVPESIRLVGGMVPGGWPEVMKRNREVAWSARQAVASALGVAVSTPKAMVGAMVAFPLPPAAPDRGPDLQGQLLKSARLEVPVMPWAGRPEGILRYSVQLYNAAAEYAVLAEALRTIYAGR